VNLDRSDSALWDEGGLKLLDMVELVNPPECEPEIEAEREIEGGPVGSVEIQDDMETGGCGK
jgi:hypothetical protein